MATAALPRKTAAGAAPNPKVPDHLSRHGAWGPVPLTFVHNLPLFCKGALELTIMLHILELTAFDYRNDRPEWVSVSYKDFTTIGRGATEAGVAKALNYLADELKVLEREDDGRGRKYRIAYENFAAAVRIADLQPKKLGPEDEEESEEPTVDDETTEIAEDDPMFLEMESSARKVAAGKPFLLRKPAKFGHERTGHDTIVRSSDPSIRVRFLGFRKGTAVLLDRVGGAQGEEKDNSTPVESSAPRSLPRQRHNDSTGVESSASLSASAPAALTRLESLLGPPFLQLFGKKLDRPYAEQILAALGGAPPEALMRLVQAKRPKQSGLILNLAKDARAAFEAGQQTGRRATPAAADAGPTFEPEPESSDSPWSRIRRLAKAEMSKAEYQNWLVPTRFVSLHNGVLTVAVPDLVTVDFLEQEYREQLYVAATTIDIGVKRFVFAVAE